MKKNFAYTGFLFISFAIIALLSCSTTNDNSAMVDIIIDTDANNELDDQHALAYAFCNRDFFNIEGVTVNNTRVGDGIEGHYREAYRIARLFEVEDEIPIKKGAGGSYFEIASHLAEENYDGKEAVDFIIRKSKEERDGKLLILALGKLTNIALAIEKDSTITERIKLLWLGTNYPDPGEYNLVNDTTALNPVFQSDLESGIALVAYGREDGTDAVKVAIRTVEEQMPGLGPSIEEAIEGRNGGYFDNFGDYSVNLWQNIQLYGEKQTRSLYDLAALMIIKYPEFAMRKEIPVPYWENGGWKETSGSDSIGFYYNFKSDSIVNQFFESLKNCGE